MSSPADWQEPKIDWNPEHPIGVSDLNRIEGNINAIETANRTLDQTQAPAGSVGSLRQLLDWFANRIKAILGTTNWYDVPPTSLLTAKSHIDASAPHSGHAPSSHVGSGGSAHAVATTAAAGFMSAEDKNNLETARRFGNEYFLPSDTVLATANGERGTTGKSPVLLKSFIVNRPGKFRIKGERRRTSYTGYIEIRCAGEVISPRLSFTNSSYGSFTVDTTLPVAWGDRVELWAWNSSEDDGVVVRNISLCGSLTQQEDYANTFKD